MTRRLPAFVLLLAFFLTACGLAESSSLSAETPTGAPTTAAPTPTVEPTATPTIAAVLPQPGDCANPEGGYVVAIPDAWYSNDGIAGAQDCTLFAQRPIAAASDPGIAIVFSVEPNVPIDPFGPVSGTFYGITTLVDEETSVAGHRAWVREFQITEPDVDAVFGVGDRYTQYFVDLGGGWHLTARTTIAGSDYTKIKTVLAQMLESLETTSQ